jgi:hypothetical protein
MDAAASLHRDLGREAKGTILVVGLGPDVIPDNAPIIFFGFDPPHGSAGETRKLLDQFGSPFAATRATADRELVAMKAARSRLGDGLRQHPGCQPLTASIVEPGRTATGLGKPAPGRSIGSTTDLRLWSPNSFTVDVRRFGDEWVTLARVPAGRDAILTLPRLDTNIPWQVRADGACNVTI